MRIKMCGETCAQITDRASGLSEVGLGDTVQVSNQNYYKTYKLDLF